MATESNTAPVTADQESALGLDANVVSALAYFPLPLVGFVLLFVEDSNEFVRFHAAQSVVTVLTIVFVRLSAEFVGSFLPGPVALLWGLLVGLVNIGFLLVLLFLAYRAYSGDRFELPVVSDVTASLLDAL
jgi:uncharacterized membrane protein